VVLFRSKKKLIFELESDLYERAKKIFENYDDPSDLIRDIIRIHEKREKMPDFLIVGAAKAGTTSLYHYLLQHPKIDGATRKELHYFDRDYNQSIDYYRTCFPSLSQPNDHITGEATPYYLIHPYAPERIYKVMPNTKIIILLRNPIDRAFSHYNFTIRQHYEPLTFEEAIEKERERIEPEFEKLVNNPYARSFAYQIYTYLKTGIYVDHLKAYYNFFPKDQILILNYEKFFSNVPNSMRIVTDFLNIDKFEFACKVLNKGSYQGMNPKTREKLRKYFRLHNQRLYELIGETYDWD
jgi:hypothetical protein